MHLGRIAGIPVRIHPTTFLAALGLVGWVCVQFGPEMWWQASLLTLLVGASVLLHEVGHGLAARHYGIPTLGIALYPWGGAAELGRDARSAEEELVVAVAGPFTNIVLAIAGSFVWAATDSRWALVFALLNVGLGVLNLVPAYPMDGGRMLRALLARRMGWWPATRRAIAIGRFMAWAMVVVGALFWSFPTVATGALLLYGLHSEQKRVAYLWAYHRKDAGYR